jgi:glycopeptide antibiotics resistance protein
MLTGEIVLAVVSRPALLLILGIAALAAWPLGRLISPGRRVLGALFALVLGAVLAATTTTVTFRPSGALVPAYLAGFGDPAYLVGGFAGSREKIANLGLFLPLGLLAQLVWQRAGAVLAGCVALTFAIELWQAFIGRGGDAVDVVHNSVGALAGIALGRVLASRRRPGARLAAAADGPD